MIEMLTIKYKGTNQYKKNLVVDLIRINLVKQNFSILKAINEICRYIEKLTEKSLIDKIWKRLLEFEFKSNHSIKSKCSKYIVKKILLLLYCCKPCKLIA